MRCRWWLTDNRRTRFALSSGRPPLLAGYSQSTSKPSKFFSRRKCRVEFINCLLDTSDLAMVLNGGLPAFQPPIAIKDRSCGCACLNAFTLSYLAKKTNHAIKVKQESLSSI